MKIGDLVQLKPQPWHTGYDLLVGIVVGDGFDVLRCRVVYTDGRVGDPMCEALEVVSENR